MPFLRLQLVTVSPYSPSAGDEIQAFTPAYGSSKLPACKQPGSWQAEPNRRPPRTLRLTVRSGARSREPHAPGAGARGSLNNNGDEQAALPPEQHMGGAGMAIGPPTMSRRNTDDEDDHGVQLTSSSTTAASGSPSPSSAASDSGASDAVSDSVSLDGEPESHPQATPESSLAMTVALPQNGGRKSHQRPLRRLMWIITWLLVAISGLVLSTLAWLHCSGVSHPSHDQRSIDRLADKACSFVGAPSICPLFLCATRELSQLFPTVCVKRRGHSSGPALAAGFAESYEALSQSVAASNAVYGAPGVLGEKRMELRRLAYRLPANSTALQPIDLFLNRSLHLDSELLDFIYSVGRTANIAVRQSEYTKQRLASIEADPMPSTALDRFVARTTGMSAQERTVQRRLRNHLSALRPAVDEIFRESTRQLNNHMAVRAIALEIRNHASEHIDLLGNQKAVMMSKHHVLARVLIKALGLPEPGEVKLYTRNLQLATQLLQWTSDVEMWLRMLVDNLGRTKVGLDSLHTQLYKQDKAIKWPSDEDAETFAILEFQAQADEGVALLLTNTNAWTQLLLGGYA